MVGILLNSCSPREKPNDSHLGLFPQEDDESLRISYGVAGSVLLTAGTVPRRAQEETSSKLPAGLHVVSEP